MFAGEKEQVRPVALTKETTFKGWTARSMLSCGPDFLLQWQHNVLFCG